MMGVDVWSEGAGMCISTVVSGAVVEGSAMM
jgi:hypothetical protein